MILPIGSHKRHPAQVGSQSDKKLGIHSGTGASLALGIKRPFRPVESADLLKRLLSALLFARFWRQKDRESSCGPELSRQLDLTPGWVVETLNFCLSHSTQWAYPSGERTIFQDFSG